MNKESEKGKSKEELRKEQMDRLRVLVDDVHQWPSVFMFKFILPTNAGEIKKLKLIFDQSSEIMTRESKNGKYTSVTVREMIMHGDDVFDRYEKAAKFEGIISL